MATERGVSTKPQIEALEPHNSTYPVPIIAKRGASIRGLAVQVTPAGCKSFVLRYRLHGRQKTLTLGRYPETTLEQAEKLALTAWEKINGGVNPADTRKEERLANTVNELAKRFTKEHLDLSPKSWAKESTRLLDKFILPAMGSQRVKDVSTADVAELLFKIRKNTPTQANRVRAVISRMFKLAITWGLRPSGINPAQSQERAEEKKKERHLSDAELMALGKALSALESSLAGSTRPEGYPEAMDPHALLAIRLLLFTGMRKSELIGDRTRELPSLTWADVDLQARLIRLQHHKTAKKAGTRMVHIPMAAVKYLKHHEENWKIEGNPNVIAGRRKGQSLVNIQGAWEDVRKAVNTMQTLAKIPKKDQVCIEDVTIHDLRRSFASVGARLGYPSSFLSGLLGHAAGSVTDIYARVSGDPLAQAADAIGERLELLLSGRIANEAPAKLDKG